MKKTLLAITIFLLNISNALAFYSDIPKTHTYYESIKTLYDLKLLPEYQNNLFKPDEALTTEALYELIITFKKANAGENSIQTAINLGILTKENADNLNPDTKISKTTALKTMFQTLGIGTSYFIDASNYTFTDIKAESSLSKIAVKAKELGILEKSDPTRFNPLKKITRGEVADYLSKINDHSSTATIIIEFTPEIESNTKIEQEKDFAILVDVWNSIQKNYYYQEEVNNQTLIYSAIQAMLGDLSDAYTVFQEPSEAKAFIDTLTNEYEGVGMLLEVINKNITIISPLKNSPAETAGLKPNDVIIKVDDEDMSEKPIDYVVSKIKGPTGTEVKLTVLRNGKEYDFEVTREHISYKSVKSEMLKKNNQNIAYIEITQFGDNSYNEFVKATETLIKDGPKGFIIDLRNNPGGYLDTAIALVSLFTDEIKPAIIMEFADHSQSTISTNGNGILKDYPIAILMNEGSASASEIMAGALQDFGLATVIGIQSFGKGSAQQLTNYTDGSLLKLTVSKWFTPNGNDIDKKGITPDITVTNIGTADNQLNKALSHLSSL